MIDYWRLTFMQINLFSLLLCQMSEMDSGLKGLPHEALLAAAFITYLSEAPEDARKATLAHWGRLLKVSTFDLRRSV